MRYRRDLYVPVVEIRTIISKLDTWHVGQIRSWEEAKNNKFLGEVDFVKEEAIGRPGEDRRN